LFGSIKYASSREHQRGDVGATRYPGGTIRRVKSDNMAEPTLCEARLDKIIASFEGKHAELLKEHPDCSEELSLLGAGLHTIKQLIHI
jgi:hypothetical protein